MARPKTKERPPPAPAGPPQAGGSSRPRFGWLIWLALGAVAAGAAFWIAKKQAQGPGRPSAPPAVGLPGGTHFHALLVSADNPDRVLLGTHAGLYESLDGGRSWRRAGLGGLDAMNLVRTSDGTVWAAGHEVLARTEDAGTSWEHVRPDGLPGLDLHGFAAVPGDPQTLYAAVANEGLYRSTDGGGSFARVTGDVGPGALGLAVAPGGRILAADPKQGLMASANGGRTWRKAYPPGVVGVAVSPAAAARMLLTGSEGILLSVNGGRRWRTVLPLEKGAGPVAWAPSDPDRAYAVGFDDTVYRSDDRGVTWKRVD